ncbi:MAG TPA: calcium-binding protein [Lysobacter sp.]|nr:calcium-binding protein [Lysobacter sp.]
MRRWTAVLLGLLLWAGTTGAASPIEEAAHEVRQAAGAHRLIVLGELHGTREVPRLAAALAAAYARAGEPVVLALELPRDGSAASRAYLHSDGGTAARQALAAHRFLRPPAPVHDGRRNGAVIELHEALRRLRARGADVAIAPIDVERSTGGAGARDRMLAERLRRIHEALPRGRVIAVVGNVHAMRFRPQGPSWPARLQAPMAWHLRDLEPFTVNVAARAGESWGCASRGHCGPRPVFPSDARSRTLGPNDPWHYALYFPRFSLAEPLR